jgi:hypothetical protein
MPTTADLINFAFEKQPTNFSDAFNEIIGQKATDAIAALRVDVANSMFADEDEETVDVPEGEQSEEDAVEASTETEAEAEEETDLDEIDWDNLPADLSDEELDAQLADLLDSEESEDGENT